MGGITPLQKVGLKRTMAMHVGAFSLPYCPAPIPAPPRASP